MTQHELDQWKKESIIEAYRRILAENKKELDKVAEDLKRAAGRVH